MKRLCSSVLAVVIVRLVLLGAQDLGFEVASIRPSPGEGSAAIRALPSGQLTATKATVRNLVLRAYGLHESQVVGGPAWVAVERFDIDARAAAPPAAGPEALMPMLRTLLAARFKLKAHFEMRELPAYVLVLARSDRRLGPQIRLTRADCSQATSLTQSQIIASAVEGWPPCGMASTVTFTNKKEAGPGITLRIRRSGVTMTEFAASFEGALGVGRPVVNRTGLEGRYDVEYSFVPLRPSEPSAQPAPPSTPNLFISLEEQLGLKLEARQAEVQVLAIDSIERPLQD
jgi:uncharacterized protein (TIGR03435 family)